MRKLAHNVLLAAIAVAFVAIGYSMENERQFLAFVLGILTAIFVVHLLDTIRERGD